MNAEMLDEIRRHLASHGAAQVINSLAYATALSVVASVSTRELQDTIRREALLLGVKCT